MLARGLLSTRFERWCKMVLLAIGLLVVDMGITAKKRANQDKEFQEQLLQSMQEDRWQREELAEETCHIRTNASMRSVGERQHTSQTAASSSTTCVRDVRLSCPSGGSVLYLYWLVTLEASLIALWVLSRVLRRYGTVTQVLGFPSV